VKLKNRKGYAINIGIITKFVTLVIKEKTRNTIGIPFKSIFFKSISGIPL